MTTEQNALSRSITHERMLVILSTAVQFDSWLKAPPKEAFAVARTYPAQAMRIVQSGFEKMNFLAA